MKKRNFKILFGLVVIMGLLGTLKAISQKTLGGASSQKEVAKAAANKRLHRADPKKLKDHVQVLTSTKKPRDYSHPEVLRDMAVYIQKSFADLGYAAHFQEFKAAGKSYQNVIASIGPEKAPRIVIGAHYDVAGDQPGADDNASGVSGLLELARLLKERSPMLEHRIDLVAYCLEEPPFFGSNEMGSAVHAASLKKSKADVKLMMSLEMIGYFTEAENSQNFPLPALKYIYPNKGNFIAVAGELSAVMLTRKVRTLMAANSKIDVQFINAPRSMAGIDLSDHRNYWDQGYPAVMVTDTAFFRNPNYHTPQDTIETLDFHKMAEVVEGVYAVATEFD